VSVAGSSCRLIRSNKLHLPCINLSHNFPLANPSMHNRNKTKKMQKKQCKNWKATKWNKELEKFQSNAGAHRTTTAKRSTSANNANVYTNYYVILQGVWRRFFRAKGLEKKLYSFGQFSAMSLATRRIRNHFPFGH